MADTHCCTDEDCVCPPPGKEDESYVTYYPQYGCCFCRLDVPGQDCGSGDSAYDNANPDRVPGKCKCDCKLNRGGLGNANCAAANPELPEFDSVTCSCGCSYLRKQSDGTYKNTCTNDDPNSMMDLEKCKCKCKNNYTCPDPLKPDYVRTSDRICECKCIDRSDSCDKKTPNWHSDKCKCQCDLIENAADPNNPCTDPKLPDFNNQECKCECNLTFTDCTTPAKPTPDKDTCSCICTKALPVVVDGVEYPNFCASISTAGQTTPAQYNQVLDPATCSCKCKYSSSDDCPGNSTLSSFGCYCSCQLTLSDCPNEDEYEVDKEKCECVKKDYTQSLLNSTLLP